MWNNVNIISKTMDVMIYVIILNNMYIKLIVKYVIIYVHIIMIQLIININVFNLILILNVMMILINIMLIKKI